MSEPVDELASTGRPRSAGAILREARQAQGMHIAALAASIKVAQKKLESLEADRFDELPDATFARALAQTVCRSLKIDSGPVLALLPQQQFTGRLEHVSEGINEPFRDRPGRREPPSWNLLRSPAIWVPLLLVAGGAALYLAPQGWFARFQPSPGGAAATGGSVVTTIPTPTPAASDVGVPGSATPLAASTEAPASAAAAATPSASSEAAAMAVLGGALQLRAKTDAWVEVQDARSQTLISRTLRSGESVQLEGQPPLRVKLGNVAGTELSFRGQDVDLAGRSRDNTARLELK